ncbi:ADP-ribosylglycohydrolase [Saccharopolyspora erythraea NRRL 2338]|uniref:ADP-ribosylglycohydrolase n=1 Tax=Saccharopolyspora erythraea TaxID=1836 RepID=A0ABN1DS38_SACER|nr:ADP-ribosylglycohydrolase family protein [Saccharopolyspora erythraea]PFG99655.1 ADP-ribosylglycohydrolase [Saccharopolyspora erythraea NRRL 2338]QRK89542.1 ADP-ribosylglycohydrolase family protein [Saccharopolyspora erythraea]
MMSANEPTGADRPTRAGGAEVEIVELTPDEVQFIEAWRMHWRQGISSNSAATEVFNDIARKALGESFVRNNAPPPRGTTGFLGRHRVVPRYEAASCAEIARNLPGAVLGGMVGDALGAPVEFESLERIPADYGRKDGTAPAVLNIPAGRITDDSQMALFVLESMIMARVRLRRSENEHLVHPRLEMQIALAQWLSTQGAPWPAVLPASMRQNAVKHFGTLVDVAEVHALRSTDAVNLQALQSFACSTEDQPERGLSTFTSPLNNEQGCGGLGRAAMVAIWTDVPERAFKLGATASLITHGHPDGYLPGGVFAVLAQHLLHERPFEEALDAASHQLSRWQGHESTSDALQRAVELARNGNVTPETLDERFGASHRAPDVLGVAVASALAHPHSFEDAVLTAVRHSGNSATAGAVCGTLMGLKLGRDALPDRFLADLELRYTAESLVDKVLEEFCTPAPPDTEEWTSRYLVAL